MAAAGLRRAPSEEKRPLGCSGARELEERKLERSSTVAESRRWRARGREDGDEWFWRKIIREEGGGGGGGGDEPSESEPEPESGSASDLSSGAKRTDRMDMTFGRSGKQAGRHCLSRHCLKKEVSIEDVKELRNY